MQEEPKDGKGYIKPKAPPCKIQISIETISGSSRQLGPFEDFLIETTDKELLPKLAKLNRLPPCASSQQLAQALNSLIQENRNHKILLISAWQKQQLASLPPELKNALKAGKPNFGFFTLNTQGHTESIFFDTLAVPFPSGILEFVIAQNYANLTPNIPIFVLTFPLGNGSLHQVLISVNDQGTFYPVTIIDYLDDPDKTPIKKSPKFV